MAERLGHHVPSRLSDPSFITSLTTSASHLNYRLNLLSSYFPTLLHSHIRGRGVLLLMAGKDTVRFVPSLIISLEEIDFAVDVVESALGIMAKEASS